MFHIEKQFFSWTYVQEDSGRIGKNGPHLDMIQTVL